MVRVIPEYPAYAIDRLGNIYSSHKKKSDVFCWTDCPALKHVYDKSCGYYIVALYGGGEHQNKRVHRLLAEAYIPNPENKPHVNHKDGDKLNNSLDNLEWATVAENTQHAYDNGLIDISDRFVEVSQYYLEGTFIKTYESIMDAERETKITHKNICQCFVGKRTHAGGYQWFPGPVQEVSEHRPVVSHFTVERDGELIGSYKYIGFWERNPNAKAAHPILVLMGDANTLNYNGFLITRHYYR